MLCFSPRRYVPLLIASVDKVIECKLHHLVGSYVKMCVLSVCSSFFSFLLISTGQIRIVGGSMGGCRRVEVLSSGWTCLFCETETFHD